MIHIIKFLPNCNIDRCNIGSEGARYISEALKVNFTLKKLVLNSNGLGVEGASIITQALKENKGLKKLSLGNITKSFISQ